MVEIKCPKCGKLVGEWKGNHIWIKKAQTLIFNPSEAVFVYCHCGHVFDAVKKILDNL